MLEALAYTGGIFLSFQLIPQIYKTFQQKNADNLSFVFLIFNCIGLCCMIVYTVLNKDWPLVASISLSFFNTLVLTCLKMYYTKILF